MGWLWNDATSPTTSRLWLDALAANGVWSAAPDARIWSTYAATRSTAYDGLRLANAAARSITNAGLRNALTATRTARWMANASSPTTRSAIEPLRLASRPVIMIRDSAEKNQKTY